MNTCPSAAPPPRSLPVPLVDVAWLQAHLADPDLIVLDASWHMPAAGRDGAAEFLAARIPGARFFDFDRSICDRASPLPHMLPTPDAFAEAVRRLGVSQHSRIVCYDSSGLFSAPRAWWMFRAMGHAEVAVLDGGLPAWQAAGLPIQSGPSASPATGDFVAHAQPAWVAALAEVTAALDDPGVRILDARSAGRFRGSDPEPRAGLRGGHMPGARSLPFGELLDQGRLLPAERLRQRFDALAPPDARLLCTCGSGVSACVIALAAVAAGRRDLAVYDGSWTEWGGRPDTPVATGD